VEGEMDVDFQFGLSGTIRKVKFYVVPQCPSPLMGMPTLEKFELVIDIATRKITEQGTGLSVHCIVADLKSTPKDKKDQKKQKEQKKE